MHFHPAYLLLPLIRNTIKKYCNRKNGFIYSGEIDELINILRMISKKPKQILAMKKNCLREAEKYTAKNVINILVKKLEDD